MPLQCYSWQCHSNLYIFNNNNNNNNFVQCPAAFLQGVTIIPTLIIILTHINKSTSEKPTVPQSVWINAITTKAMCFLAIWCAARFYHFLFNIQEYRINSTQSSDHLILSDVSPWPWSLRPKSKSLALILQVWPWYLKSWPWHLKSLALIPQVLSLDTCLWPWYLKSLALIPQVLGLDTSSPWPYGP